MKFKRGDRVRVKQNDQLIDKKLYYDSTSDMSGCWINEMGRFIGKEFTLTGRDCFGWRMRRGGFYCKLLEDWLEYANNTTDKFNDAMRIL